MIQKKSWKPRNTFITASLLHIYITDNTSNSMYFIIIQTFVTEICFGIQPFITYYDSTLQRKANEYESTENQKCVTQKTTVSLFK